jgi:hypothetical protein
MDRQSSCAEVEKKGLSDPVGRIIPQEGRGSEGRFPEDDGVTG